MTTRFYAGLERLESISLMSGFTPFDVRAAYGFTKAFHAYGHAAEGQGVTIAIVDAYNDPTIRHDVAVYDAHYGLRPADLSVDNLGTNGNTGGAGWSVEEALDVETVHSLLPLAHVVLVEASSPLLVDMATAEVYAASIPGVDAISNSWGGAGDPADSFGDSAYDSAFGANPKVVYAAAAGDSSGPLSYPSSLPDVVAVGGTVLHEKLGRYTQTPWLPYAAGADNPAKTGPDVRMVGGPPGVEVFGTSGFGKPTWTNVWGTSLSCPSFVAVVGAADGVRIARGEQPLGTAEVLEGMTPDEVPSAPEFIEKFA